MRARERAEVEASKPALYVSPASDRARGTSTLIPRTRIYAGFRLGAGGKVKDEEDGEDTESFDLKPTFGFQAGAGYVWRYFGIGGELRVSSFKIDIEREDFDADVERDKTVDFVAKPRVGYQLENIPLEFYGSLPVGFSVVKMSDSEGIDFDVGLTVGFVAGASYFFTERFGVNAEIGWLMHSYDYAYSDGDYEDGKGSVTFKQFSPIALNFMFAL